MKIIKFLGFPFIIISFFTISIPFQSCKTDDGSDDIYECDTCIEAYKPNIYIYPKEQIQLLVQLDFPLGGKIIKSIPKYRTGWNIIVDTNGLINNSYSYLFYESTQPNVWQKDYGWITKTNELESFFRKNMAEYGFIGREIDDFIDYWIPRLNNYPFYSIYPQTEQIIDKVIQLSLSKQPDNLLRLFYVIEGHNRIQDKLPEPSMVDFNRDGYFVTEWGVILE